MNIEAAFSEISELIRAHHEWLLIRQTGKSFAVQSGELDISNERGKIIFGFLDDKGFQLRRVNEYKIERENLTLDLTANFGREAEKIKLVARISSNELSAAVELARLEKANQIAALIVAENSQAKLIRVSLNQESGRFANIIFELSNKTQIAALSDVSELNTPEYLLTSAIFWLLKLQTRRKNPPNKIWILAEKKSYKNLRKLHALLDSNWQTKIQIKEIRRNAKTQTSAIFDVPPISFVNLWREKPPKISLAEIIETSRTSEEIIKLAPEKIDRVFTRHGETLRFAGLPFARVRKIGAAEKAWFGIGRDKRILNEATRTEFFDLLETLELYRRFDSANKRHEFYRLAPEAWLEAILRRNVKLLDNNLILSPIHPQFRAANDKIDLLALRSDGRLIVIELKTETDREMIFQAADYWRKIELQRRSGNLARAKIFSDLKISDKPALVYLVAPTLSFHRDFEFLSKTISPNIEIYRFDLNENWRENLKVMKATEVGTEK